MEILRVILRRFHTREHCIPDARDFDYLGVETPGLGSAADRHWTGTITCVRERTCGANWYQPRIARNSGVAMASGLASS